MGTALLLSGLKWHYYDLFRAVWVCVSHLLLIKNKTLTGSSSIPLNGDVYLRPLLPYFFTGSRTRLLSRYNNLPFPTLNKNVHSDLSVNSAWTCKALGIGLTSYNWTVKLKTCITEWCDSLCFVETTEENLEMWQVSRLEEMLCAKWATYKIRLI